MCCVLGLKQRSVNFRENAFSDIIRFLHFFFSLQSPKEIQINDENNIHIPSLGSQVKSPLFVYCFLQYILCQISFTVIYRKNSRIGYGNSIMETFCSKAAQKHNSAIVHIKSV